MENNLDRIIVLLKKSFTGNCSGQERKELDEWLKDDVHLKQISTQWCDDEFVEKRLTEYQAYSHQAAYGDFCRRVKKSHKLKRGWKMAVAAVVLCLLSIAGSLLMPEQAMKRETRMENVMIPPGGMKAQLRLADGSVVSVGEEAMQIEEKTGALIDYKEGGISYPSGEISTELVYHELVVPWGGECYVVLADGSKVWVNAGSTLRYPVGFGASERKVYLEGEAYFDVVKENRLFVVTTSFGEINVLGTSFGVKAYKDETVGLTTLVRGKVCFKTMGGKSVVIGPGEQAVAFRSGILEKRNVDPEEYVGWKEGLYVFRNQSLEEIMTNLGRWYNVTVFYRNPALKRIEFTGNLKRYDTINAFMEMLQSTGEMNYQISGNTVIIY